MSVSLREKDGEWEGEREEGRWERGREGEIEEGREEGRREGWWEPLDNQV